MDSFPLVSIIVPIYKVQDFLEACIDSILQQSYKNLEIILVDDGSPDNCGLICDDYAKKDDRIVVIHKENGGLSDARNAGLDICKGDYVWFIDSDDYLLSDNLFKLMQTVINDDLDMISFGFKKVAQDGNELPTIISYESINNILNGEELLNNYALISNVWMYIFKKKIIDEYNIRFIKGIYHEDEAFTTVYASYVNKFKYLPIYLYAYLQRADSIMSTSDYAKKVKRICDMIIIIKYIYDKSSMVKGAVKIGLERKAEQLLVSIFLRLKYENIKFEDIDIIINELKINGLYPIDIKYQRSKFKIIGFLLNKKMFLKFYFNRNKSFK